MKLIGLLFKFKLHSEWLCTVCTRCVHWVIGRKIALFIVNFSHLYDNVFERGCEAISSSNCKIAGNCIASASSLRDRRQKEKTNEDSGAGRTCSELASRTS